MTEDSRPELIRRLLASDGATDASEPGAAGTAAAGGAADSVAPGSASADASTVPWADERWDAERPRAKPPSVATATRLLPAKRWLRLGVFALAVVGLLGGLGELWLHLANDPLADARAYYDAATRLNAGLPLYPHGADPNVADFYRYPPLLAIVLRPIVALLPYPVFAVGWEALVAAAFGLTVRQLGVRSPRTWLAVGLLGIPIGWALAIGQAQILVTLLVAIGQPWSIALGANLKLFPALIALWWLGRRNFQAVVAFVAWSAVLGVAQLILEPTGTQAFLRSVGLDEVGHVLNLSPYALSPVLWGALVALAAIATVWAARTRWGWPLAVALSTLASPRLLLYMLASLLAAVREPPEAGVEPPAPAPSSTWTRTS